MITELWSKPAELVTSAHMCPYLDPSSLRESISLAEEALSHIDFDTVAFRGMSGAFLGPIIAADMHKKMILVRKPEDSTHSPLKTEGNSSAKRYVIVDDFISSGRTRTAIVDAVYDFAPRAKYLGTLEVKTLDEKVVRKYKKGGKAYPLTQ